VGHSRAEKAQSRERILAAAAMRIRESGLESISVGEIMKSVNLTHGGFYGHFASRADLVAAALERAVEEGSKASAMHASHAGTATVKSIVNAYLSPVHRDHPSTGCAIPSLAAEAARAEPAVKSIMADQLRAAFATMEAAYAGGDDGGASEGAEQFAVTALATMIGAMTISRVLGDGPESDHVLALARKSLLKMEAAGKR
jgi:TetR/AcrR family transcriptional regulator, transcriptional repressor for nem operon